ncbi:MAG: hypothetical protein WCF84_18180, partial [Anaerolineae bacterium]
AASKSEQPVTPKRAEQTVRPPEPPASSTEPAAKPAPKASRTERQAQPSEAAPAGKNRLSMDPEVLLATAREMVAGGNSAGALEYYERALQRGPRFVSTVIGDLEEVVKDPNAPMPAHRLLGDAYAMAGRFKDALVQYRWVLNK